MTVAHLNSTATLRRVPTWRASNNVPPPTSRLWRQRDSLAARIQQQVRCCLESSCYAPVRVLHCRIARGTLVIQGQVPSYYLKQVAQELVRALNLAHPIVNEITVTDNDNR